MLSSSSIGRMQMWNKKDFMQNLINDGLDLSSSDTETDSDSDNETDNDTDNESNE